jgi:hypothetical protein
MFDLILLILLFSAIFIVSKLVEWYTWKAIEKVTEEPIDKDPDA